MVRVISSTIRVICPDGKEIASTIGQTDEVTIAGKTEVKSGIRLQWIQLEVTRESGSLVLTDSRKNIYFLVICVVTAVVPENGNVSSDLVDSNARKKLTINSRILVYFDTRTPSRASVS